MDGSRKSISEVGENVWKSIHKIWNKLSCKGKVRLASGNRSLMKVRFTNYYLICFLELLYNSLFSLRVYGVPNLNMNGVVSRHDEWILVFILSKFTFPSSENIICLCIDYFMTRYPSFKLVSVSPLRQSTKN